MGRIPFSTGSGGGFRSVRLRECGRCGERCDGQHREGESMGHGLFRRRLLLFSEWSVIGEDHAVLFLVLSPMREQLGVFVGILL